MNKHSINSKAFLHILSSVFLLFSTTAYANVGDSLSYMESAQNISIFRFLSIATVVITLMFMWFMKKELTSRRSVIVGVLLTVLGLLHVVTWSVNYMVIGMGLISLSGMLLAYDNGISKLIYILGLLFISVFASIEFGAGAQFIYNVGLLYIIGAGLILFVPDDSSKYIQSYKYESPVTQEVLDRDFNDFSKIRDRVESSETINAEKAKKITFRFALLLMAIMIAMLLFSAKS